MAELELPVSSGAASVEVNTQGEGQNGRQLAWMRGQLSRFRYLDWTLRIEPGSRPDGPAVLLVYYQAEDSRKPGRQIGLLSRRRIGPYLDFDEDRFALDVKLRLLHACHGHELDENLLRDGRRLFDPHTDPDRWHCTHCGGVGPKRTKPLWECPGCGTVAGPVKAEETL